MSASVVPEVFETHEIPSEDVIIVPELPIATKRLFPKVIPKIGFVVPGVLDVQVIPSAEVMMVAILQPPITNRLFPNVILSSSHDSPEFLRVQVIALFEVKTDPVPPTVTYVPFPYVILRK